jgi:hypothetical protein
MLNGLVLFIYHQSSCASYGDIVTGSNGETYNPLPEAFHLGGLRVSDLAAFENGIFRYYIGSRIDMGANSCRVLCQLLGGPVRVFTNAQAQYLCQENRESF